MTEWSRLVPSDGPKAVETARTAVLTLRARIGDSRKALEVARAAVTEAERDDRQRMAESLRAGREARADDAPVTKARQRVESVTRESEALTLAIQAAEDDLGEACERSRRDWAQATERATVQARERVRSAVAELEESLTALATQLSTTAWLAPQGGLDRHQGFHNPALGWLGQSSAAVTANHDPVAVSMVLGWLREFADPPAAPAPVEPQPLRPVAH